LPFIGGTVTNVVIAATGGGTLGQMVERDQRLLATLGANWIDFIGLPRRYHFGFMFP
jgi:hypothetical protein